MNNDQLEDLALDARVDIAARISLAMQRLGKSAAQVAADAKLSKGRMSQILSGDENLQVDTIVKVLAAIECRFDMVVTQNALDEWHVKRLVADLENSLWPELASWADNSFASEGRPAPSAPIEIPARVTETSLIRSPTKVVSASAGGASCEDPAVAEMVRAA